MPQSHVLFKGHILQNMQMYLKLAVWKDKGTNACLTHIKS